MEEKTYDFRTVSARLPQNEVSRFIDYCEKKGVSQSQQIREMIKEKVEKPVPVNVAGKNVFLYNKASDSFTWRIILDDGNKRDVVEELAPEFLKELNSKISEGIEERKTYLRKDKEDSVPIPNRMVSENE